jgi:hypothetical protein
MALGLSFLTRKRHKPLPFWGNKPGGFLVKIPKHNAMFFRKKKKQDKEQAKKSRHDEVMRAKYAALMMGYHVSADLLDEEGEAPGGGKKKG